MALRNTISARLGYCAASLLLSLCVSGEVAQAQTALTPSLTIQKIDPPNWYATLPKPMLLVRGEGFVGASFSLSDPALKIERTEVSQNGHWAELWLTASPARPETVQLHVRRGAANTEMAYIFSAGRFQADGMAGFSQADVMYLVVTDRFNDGDRSNDGPTAHSSASSAEAAAERAKPRGWHGGDLQGIAQKLDYLQSLGVTTVWPTPVYQNHGPEAYHGYHATDYYAVDEHYGSLADLQSLAKALHARGMKLVLDTVPNHVGPFHPWVEDEPTPDWFHGTAPHHLNGETNFNALIDKHSPGRDRVGTLDGWFANSLPDMNTDNAAVAQYLRQNTVWWIEQTGADGLRIDTFPYVDRPFWHAFTSELHTLYPHLTEVGEVSNADPEVTSAFADGVTRAGVDTGLYTPFDFPFYHAMRDIFVHGAPMTRLTRVLVSDELYPHPERLVPFLGNHDEPRFAEEVHDPALQRIADTLLATTRGMPQLYAGDEIAMRGGEDPYNRNDFPGGFGSQPDAFVSEGRTPEQQESFAFLQRLLALRRLHPALQSGEEQVLKTDEDVLVYTRTLVSEHILVAINKGPGEKTVAIPIDNTSLAGMSHAQILLGDAAAASVVPHVLTVHLAAKSECIVKLD